jgi:hypothetical protein
MSISDYQLPRAHPKVIWTALPDGAVLYETETEQYFGVNSVGALVWELLPPPTTSFEDLCRAVHARYPEADLDQIRGDVRGLLDDLRELGLVRHSEAL